MKKFLVVVLALAMVCISSVAFALDVTLSGMIDVRSRMFLNTGTGAAGTALANSHADQSNDNYTQTRYMVNVNIKGDGVKGKISFWNDHETWTGRGAKDNAKGLGGPNIREAWIDFMLPGTPVGLKAGRMVGMIGQGWFERSTYGGQDAWVVYANLGKVATIALQDVKITEGTTTLNRDDVDLYSLIATVKPADAVTVGVDVSYLDDKNGAILGFAPSAGGKGSLWNIGANFSVKAGPATIKGQMDVQSGKSGARVYDGFQGIVQAAIPVGIVTINAGAAYGSGVRESGNGGMVVLSDIAQHYTLIYEYRTKGASGATSDMLKNTWFLTAGAKAQVAKSLSIGADIYWLNAVERVAMKTGGSSTKDIGFELDANLNWQIMPNLSWSWQVGMLSTGSAYRGSDGTNSDIYCAQGILALTF